MNRCAFLAMLLAAPALAQSGGPRTPALSTLKTLEREEWVQVRSAIGDRHISKARTAPGAVAAKEYRYAFEYCLFREANP